MKATLLLLLLCGCASPDTRNPQSQISIVTTPEYTWLFYKGTSEGHEVSQGIFLTPQTQVDIVRSTVTDADRERMAIARHKELHP